MSEIKGSKANSEEIKSLIYKIGLEEKSNCLCSTLSGGQKRKLCIALALIGNSNIILLDEPTSGMDAISRKELWEFLKNYQKDKIILLITHYLEEAEYLGDRIGIMSDGQFICCGTSSFLKSKYPCGFNINLLVNSDKFTEEKKIKIYEKIQSYEPNVYIRFASKCSFSLNIPSDNKNISDIFRFIEESRKEFDIEDFTVASTSLEDVFLKINNQYNLNDMKYLSKSIGSQEILIPEKLIEINDFFTQFMSQLKRHFFPIYRNKLMLLLEYLSGLAIIYIIFSLLYIEIDQEKKINLNLIDILEGNKIYIYEDSLAKGVLKDSYECNSITKTLEILSEKPIDIKHLIDLAYEESLAHIAMGCISINQIGDEWNTYITRLNLGNLFADTMLVVSAFLKKQFGINAIILNQIEMKRPNNEKNLIYSIQNIYFGNLLGYFVFLGGLINEKIKERKKNTKHLLYLSGSNSWSYWIAFFIIDYLKLFVFTILLIMPIYYLDEKEGTNLFLHLFIINASSLIFIYCISFFGTNEKSGIKFLMLLSITSFTYLFILVDIFLIFESSNLDNYFFFFLYFTPITSMVLHFLFKMLGNSHLDKIYHFYPTYKVQLINLVVYFLVLILMEAGHLRAFFGWLKVKLCLKKNNFVFSHVQLPNEFPMYHNENKPSLQSQINKKTNQFQEITNNTNYNSEIFSIRNSNSNSMKTQLFENNNQDNIEMQESNIQRDNCFYDSIKQPLIQERKDDLLINDSNELSIKKISFPEDNLINNIKKDNPFVNTERNKLAIRNDFTVIIEGLKKTYWLCCRKNVKAINDLYLGLEANENFGLLGFNGSGKTTIFKIITNELLYNYGKIRLFGFDTRKQFKYIRSRIGYCPQENPLFDFMKVREILEFYSNLKTCFFSLEEIYNNFGLNKYLDTYCVNLSGGNKRKLTFAIAIMNRPSLLLLDEPSTGVDPDSKRFMWKNINELSNNGHRYNMILTTHSMEEAEILCDRVSWLKQGRFVCIGNPEKLKIQYNSGYKLNIKFDEQVINQNKDIYNIDDAFQTISELVEGFTNYSNYIMENYALESHIKPLITIVKKIKPNIKSIILAKIKKDLSFELILNIIQERKYNLFSDILNMKNFDKNISEIIISMESLENILTSFK